MLGVTVFGLLFTPACLLHPHRQAPPEQRVMIRNFQTTGTMVLGGLLLRSDGS
jgi:hypothetical protein